MSPWKPNLGTEHKTLQTRIKGTTHMQEIYTRNSYKKCAPNRMQLYSVQVSGIRNFQTQPTNQTAHFFLVHWYKILVQVS